MRHTHAELPEVGAGFRQRELHGDKRALIGGAAVFSQDFESGLLKRWRADG